MGTIRLTDFTSEAASMGKGKELKIFLEELIKKNEDIVVDFNGLARFASPFFNNSFSALALQYGFEEIEKIKLINISQIGRDTFESSLDNARLLFENPKYSDEIGDIISTAPKRVE